MNKLKLLNQKLKRAEDKLEQAQLEFLKSKTTIENEILEETLVLKETFEERLEGTNVFLDTYQKDGSLNVYLKDSKVYITSFNLFTEYEEFLECVEFIENLKSKVEFSNRDILDIFVRKYFMFGQIELDFLFKEIDKEYFGEDFYNAVYRLLENKDKENG